MKQCEHYPYCLVAVMAFEGCDRKCDGKDTGCPYYKEGERKDDKDKT